MTWKTHQLMPVTELELRRSAYHLDRERQKHARLMRRAVEEGASVRAVARAVGLSHTTVARMIKEEER